MKKAVAAYWVFALSLVLLNLWFLADANAQLPDRSLSLETLAPQLKTPESIARFLWKNFSFENDERQFGKDHWQSPQEFLSNHKGDCEDFARFAYEILKRNGAHPLLVNVYSRKSGHTICLYKEDGNFKVIDGSRVRTFQNQNLREVIQKLNPFFYNRENTD